MSTLSKEEKNRLIAEALEPFESLPDPKVSCVFRTPKGAWLMRVYPNGGGIRYWDPLDFYTDETASAMVLEAMPQPVLEKLLSNDPALPVGDFTWFCFHDCDSTGVPEKSKDRKTAIADAFVAWKQSK